MLEVRVINEGGASERLRFDAGRVRRFTRLVPKVISVHGPADPGRREVESYLEAAYARAFGGRLTHHYPRLLSVRDPEGRIHVAAGFRKAADGPLFLEQYLDGPVEHEVGEALSRGSIAEIGNLASHTPGASMLLFLALARQLHQAGCTHAVATATRQLRKCFARAGFATRQLAEARADRLKPSDDDWGDYYDHDPMVLGGAIGPALPVLGGLLAASQPVGAAA